MKFDMSGRWRAIVKTRYFYLLNFHCSYPYISTYTSSDTIVFYLHDLQKTLFGLGYSRVAVYRKPNHMENSQLPVVHLIIQIDILPKWYLHQGSHTISSVAYN